MLKFSKQIVFIAIVLFAMPVFSQNKKALQEKREQIEKDIKYTNKLLKKTKKNKEKSLAYLKVLSTQLKNREELLQMLNIEISFIEKQIGETTIKIVENRKTIEEKKKELIKLKQDYAKMIYYAYKNKHSFDSWVFIFSSKMYSLNESIRFKDHKPKTGCF